MNTIMNFKDFGLSQTLLDALDVKGFNQPTYIQEQCIPLLLNTEMDIVAQSQTGTGKTAAFGLPIINSVDTTKKEIQALVLTPTRELAKQVSNELSSLGGKSHIEIASIYGGQSYTQQISQLKRGTHVVVGTPGRIIDLIKKQKLILDHIEFFILDEADEMLNMGFLEEVEEILDYCPSEKRMLLFSATMPSRILNLAKQYMQDYQFIKVKRENIFTDLTDQIYFEVEDRDKFESLCRIIDVSMDFYGLIFCRTKVEVDALNEKLMNRGYAVEGLHGDFSQNQREKTFKKFKEKRINILVATDVAARGIDVCDLTHVINYDLPQDPEGYVHRIGRTGRAGKKGTAITLVTKTDYRRFDYIRKRTNASIRKEPIPSIKKIMKIKKWKMIAEIEAIMKTGVYERFDKIALEMVEHHEPKKIISALLKHAYHRDYDDSIYDNIRDIPDMKDKVDIHKKKRNRRSNNNRFFGSRKKVAAL